MRISRTTKQLHPFAPSSNGSSGQSCTGWNWSRGARLAKALWKLRWSIFEETVSMTGVLILNRRRNSGRWPTLSVRDAKTCCAQPIQNEEVTKEGKTGPALILLALTAVSPRHEFLTGTRHRRRKSACPLQAEQVRLHVAYRQRRGGRI